MDLSLQFLIKQWYPWQAWQAWQAWLAWLALRILFPPFGKEPIPKKGLAETLASFYVIRQWSRDQLP